MFVEGNPCRKTDSESNFSYWSSLNVSGVYSWYIPSSLSNARPSKCSLKNALASMFICNMSHGRFLTSLRCQNSKMASAEQFSITPYCFEPEYSSNEESSNSSNKNESSNSEEECIGHLGTLEWCKCENCSTTTLNHLSIVIRGDWLWKAGNINDKNNSAAVYVGSTLKVHNPLFSVSKLLRNKVMQHFYWSIQSKW